MSNASYKETKHSMINTLRYARYMPAWLRQQPGYAFLLMAGLLTIYLLLRSVIVTILHDVVSTYIIYIKRGNFIPWTAYPDANNHFLNSLLTWISFKAFGNSEWALRLPNVLMFPLFLLSVYKVSRFLDSRILRIAFLVVLCTTHGFIEFFGFARGYGMSMALLMLTVWMVLAYGRSRRDRNLWIAMLSAALAVMANLNLLPSMGLISLYLLWMVMKEKMTLIRFFRLLFPGLILALVLLLAVKHSFYLKGQNLLYYGGETGMYNAIFRSHARMLFFSESNILIITALFIGLATGILYLVKLIKSRFTSWYTPTVFLFALLLAGSFVVILGMHFLMDVQFPEDRTSLFLYPYFIGFVFFTLDYVRLKWTGWMLVPFLYVPIHFFTHLNLTYSTHWHHEHIPASFFSQIETNQDPRYDLAHHTISGYKIHEQVWAYYVANQYPGFNLINPANYPNDIDDFLLLRKEEEERSPLLLVDYALLERDPWSSLSLWRRKALSERLPLFERSVMRDSEITTDEFIGLLPDTTFDFIHKSLVFQFDIQLETDEDYLNSSLVVTVWDSLRQAVDYQRIEMDWLSERPLRQYSASLSVLHIPEQAHSIVAYLYNKNKQPVRITAAGLKVFELVKPGDP